ncbi:acyltransferase family protein [Bacteroides sp.]|uniref:acyltransferase family protein n=1 Tax=Bacteroides sp. TaxID=29523 RepID=UPI00345DF589
MRLSNFEALRIVAMLLVLVVHTCFVSIGRPNSVEIIQEPVLSFWRLYEQSLASVCVNVFIMISGWFMIKPSFRGLCMFLYQILFFSILIFITSSILYAFSYDIPYFKCSHFSFRGLVEASMVVTRYNWFIASYIILFILSPVLNSFITSANRRIFFLTLLSFFILEIYTDYIRGGETAMFDDGYGVLSFIGLYLLSAFLKKFYHGRLHGKKRFLIYYMLFSLITAALTYFLCRYGYPRRIYQYNSPFIIASSVCLFLFFAKMSFNSRFVNWIAASSFAVFLFNVHPLIFNGYKDFNDYIFQNNIFPIYYLIKAIFVGSFFVFAILLDQFRKYSWNLITKCYINGN